MRTNDQARIRAVKLQHDSHMIRVCLIEDIKTIYMFTICSNVNYIYDKTGSRVVH